MAENTAPQGCTYTHLENGVHEFVFQDADKASVDFFFNTLADILRTTPNTGTARYILDVTQSARDISLSGMVQRFRKLDVQIPVRARGRTAVLHNPGLTYSFIDGLVRALAPGKDKTRFFPVDRRDDAIAWVLSDN